MAGAPTPVRAALLGVGAWGRVLARAAAGSRSIQIVCCWGRTPSRLADFSRETGIEARESLDAITADASVEAVLIAVPNEHHHEFAAMSAAAGKHLYIEKPIANTLPDALRIKALEQAHSISIAVGHCARLLAGNRLIGTAISSGDLGRLTQIEATFSHDRGLRLSPNDWRWYQASAPGGPLSQIALHQFDTLRYLGGDLESVSAAAARHSPVGAEVEDQWIVTVRFRDGKLGCVISNWTSPGAYSVRVTGDKASMFYEVDQTHWSNPERLHEGATLYRQPRGVGPSARERIEVPPGNIYREELDLFAQAVRSGTAPELSADNACKALAAVYAAIASARNRGALISIEETLAEASRGATDVA